MKPVPDIRVGDPVVIQLPSALVPDGEEAKRVRGIVEAVDGDDVTVRVADVAETADPDAPVVTCHRADVVPAAVGEIS
jgi:hypothetical protein